MLNFACGHRYVVDLTLLTLFVHEAPLASLRLPKPFSAVQLASPAYSNQPRECIRRTR